MLGSLGKNWSGPHQFANFLDLSVACIVWLYQQKHKLGECRLAWHDSHINEGVIVISGMV